MLDCQRKPLFADPAIDVTDQIIVGESHPARRAAPGRPSAKLEEPNRTSTPGISCVVTNMLIRQILRPNHFGPH